MNRNMEAIVWAMNARGLSQAGWRVLVMLAKRVGKRGFDVWPKHKTLAEDCDMGVSTVRRALRELEGDEKEGRPAYIKIIPRFDDEGDRTSNIYRLQVHATLSYPAGADVDIHADDEDDEPSIPSREEREGVRSNRAHPPAQIGRTVRSNRADGVLASGQAEHIQGEHIQGEDSPLSFGEPAPGEADLFGSGNGAIVPVEEPLEELVLAGWKQLKADFPGVTAIVVLNDAKRASIRARTREVIEGYRRDGKALTPREVWEELFNRIRASTFLTGRAPPGRGRTGPFRLTIDYVLRQSQFSNILAGGYDDGIEHNRSFDADSGRRFGPAEQAIRGALGGLLASHQRGAAGRSARGNHS